MQTRVDGVAQVSATNLSGPQDAWPSDAVARVALG